LFKKKLIIYEIMKKWLFAFLFLFNFVVLSQEYTLKQIIKISDSLELNEKYIDAIDFWKKNTSVFPILSKNYISYFEYWNDFENQSFDTIISI